MHRINWRTVGVYALAAVAVALALYVADGLGGTVAGLALAAGFPVIPKGYQELNDAAYPLTAGVPETLPYWWYDTQAYAAAGSLAEIPFFQAVAADRTLSNWVVAGTLPEPMYFGIWHIMADIFPQAAPYVTTNAGVLGQLDNVGLMTQIGRPIVTLTLSQKDYGPWPFSLLHATGGPTGGLQGTTAAAGSTQFGNNGIFDGGLRLQGAILIPPKTDFSIRIRMGVAITPTTAQFIRITMGGVLYRAVK